MNVVVIGGGPAGMMAAITAAGNGNNVTLVEKNNKLGKKLFLTGKGRCNVTNSCDMEELFNNVVVNQKFLYSAFYTFDNTAVMNFFENIGLKLKIERGNRVFPVSDHSSDVIKYLELQLNKLKVNIIKGKEVVRLSTQTITDDIDKSTEVGKKNRIICNKKIDGVFLKDNVFIKADAVIMATGGASYPSTGSDAVSFGLLKDFDISVNTLYPALVPFEVKESYVYEMSGLSLKNVSISLFCGDKKVYSGFGEMLFTHFGVSGPLILSASSHLNKSKKAGDVILYIDLKPSLSLQELNDRILRDFNANINKQFKNSLSGLLPNAMIPSVILLSGIDDGKQVNSITKEERINLCNVIKNYKLTITGNRGFNEAIITNGGVSVKEINPSTMESKRVKGLYFAGEMIDVDALTGGFNLQIAWSTAYLAGLLGGDND